MRTSRPAGYWSEKKRAGGRVGVRGKTERVGRGFPVKSPPSCVNPAKYSYGSVREQAEALNAGEHTCETGVSTGE